VRPTARAARKAGCAAGVPVLCVLQPVRFGRDLVPLGEGHPGGLHVPADPEPDDAALLVQDGAAGVLRASGEGGARTKKGPERALRSAREARTLPSDADTWPARYSVLRDPERHRMETEV
jgi:hypothetical protein